MTGNVNQKINALYKQGKLNEARELLKENINSLTPDQLAQFLLEEVEPTTPANIEFIRELLGHKKIREAKIETRGKILFHLLNRDVLFNHKLHSDFVNNETLTGLCKYITEDRKLSHKKEIIEKIGERIANQPRLLAHFLFLRGIEVIFIDGLLGNKGDIVPTFENSFRLHNETTKRTVENDIQRFIDAHFQLFSRKWGEAISIDIVEQILDLAKKTCNKKTVEVLEAYVNVHIRKETSSIAYSQNYVVEKQGELATSTPFLKKGDQQVKDDKETSEGIEGIAKDIRKIQNWFAAVVRIMVIEPQSLNVGQLGRGAIKTLVTSLERTDLSGRNRGSKKSGISEYINFLQSAASLVRATQGEKAEQAFVETMPASITHQETRMIQEVEYHGCTYSFYLRLLGFVNNPEEFKQACTSSNMFASEQAKGFFCHVIKNKLDVKIMNLLVARFYECAGEAKLANRLCSKAVEAIYHEEFNGAEFDTAKESVVAAFLNNEKIPPQHKRYVVEQMIREDKYFDLCIKVLGERVRKPDFFKATLGAIIRDEFGKGPDKVIIDKIVSKGYANLYSSIASVICDVLLSSNQGLDRMKGFVPKLSAECIMAVKPDKTDQMVDLYFKTNPNKRQFATVVGVLFQCRNNYCIDRVMASTSFTIACERQNAVIAKAIISDVGNERFKEVTERIQAIHKTEKRSKTIHSLIKHKTCTVEDREKLRQYGKQLFELCASKGMSQEVMYSLISFDREDTNPDHIPWALAFAMSKSLAYGGTYELVIMNITGALARYSQKYNEATPDILAKTLRAKALKLQESPEIVAFSDLFSVLKSEYIHPNFKQLLEEYVKKEDLHQISQVVGDWMWSTFWSSVGYSSGMPQKDMVRER